MFYILNSYELSRKWFNWCFDNPEKIKPNHTALYFFCIEHCNRLGWQEKFGLPTEMAKSAIGIHSYNTYTNTLTDLIEWGFIKMIQKSKNQYSSNIIALSNFNKAPTEALDKAIINHASKQSESIGESIDSINKPINQQTINNETFERFWNLYDKKEGRKDCERKFAKLKQTDIDKIFETLPAYIASTPDKKYRKMPETYLNGEHWNDEIASTPQTYTKAAPVGKDDKWYK